MWISAQGKYNGMEKKDYMLLNNNSGGRRDLKITYGVNGEAE